MSAPVSTARHVGVVDWGIGGLDLHGRLSAAHPGLRTTYLSDSGFAPYGKVDSRELAARLGVVIGFLVDQGAEAVVVACNAASSALPGLQSHRDVAVTGVIAPTLATLLSGPRATVGILGGVRTIASRSYEAPLVEAGFPVRAAVAQPLSALVEAGCLEGPAVADAVRDACDGVGRVDVLVPACTHYVALLPAILRALGPARVVDPATETLAWIERHWSLPLEPAAAARATDARYFTTGDPAALRRGAHLAFGLDVPHAHHVATLP